MTAWLAAGQLLAVTGLIALAVVGGWRAGTRHHK